MIIKIMKNRASFKDSIEYAAKKADSCIDFDIKTLEYEIARMEYIASLNTHVQNPVMHAVMSLPPQKHLTDQQWKHLVDWFKKDLGYEFNQSVAIKHNDTANEHVHIILNRVSYVDNKVSTKPFEKRRAFQLTNEMRHALGLPKFNYSLKPKVMSWTELQMQKRIHQEKTAICRSHGATKFSQLPKHALEEINQLDLKMIKRSLKSRIEFAHANSRNQNEFVTSLNHLGVIMKYKKDGEKVNISFGLKTRTNQEPAYMRDIKIGKKYTFENLFIHLPSHYKFQYALRAQKVTQPITPGIVTTLNFRKGKSREYEWFPKMRAVTVNMRAVSLFKKAHAQIPAPPEPEPEEEEEDPYLKQMAERQTIYRTNRPKGRGR